MSAPVPNLVALGIYQRVATSESAADRALGRELMRDLFDQLGEFVDDNLRLAGIAVRQRRPWVTGTEADQVFRGLCEMSQALTRDARLIDEFANEVRGIWDEALFEIFMEFIDSAIRGEGDLPLGLEQAVFDWALDVPDGVR